MGTKTVQLFIIISAALEYKRTFRASVNTHYKMVHEKIKPFHCELCPTQFFWKNALQLHTKTIHEKIKKFECVICLVKFGTKSNLSQHIGRIHQKCFVFLTIVEVGCMQSFFIWVASGGLNTQGTVVSSHEYHKQYGVYFKS